MHFLGTSKLEWALLLTDIQRAVRKYHNPNFTISFDCASPFLATANGQIYVSTEIQDRNKWLYRMLPSADDKKYATDTREFITAVNQDNIFKGRTFTNSPVMENVPIKDICIYKPGDLNKIGKEGKTSWDSFSYAIMMGHNVWQHINSVQEANRQYDAGLCPAMLVDEKFDQVFFKDVIEAIFCTSDRGIAESIVEEYSKFWMAIPGTRGATGKRTINTSTTFANLFDVVESEPVQCDEDYEQDESKLDELEESVK
jgi:tRNA(Leu) C34 or U34 (ribose-2'-O)-methylase TrmL